MAQNFSNNTLFAAQDLLDQTFRFAHTYTTTFDKTPDTIVGLAANQTANVSPIWANDNHRICRGYEAHFTYIDSQTEPTLSNTAVTAGCTIGTGKAMTGNHVDYSRDIFGVDTFEYDTALCGTIYAKMDNPLAALFRDLSIAATHQNMMALNAEAISRIDTNVQTPTYASSIGTISGNTIYISDLNKWDAKNFGSDLMPYFDDIADQNNLAGNYIILGGSVLGIAARTSGFIRVNDNQRSEGLVFDTYGDRLVVDRKGFTAAGLGENIYLIDPNVYAAYVQNMYPQSVENVMDDKNTRRFSVPLRYAVKGMNNELQTRQFTFANNGQMQNAFIDLRLQTVCNEGGYSDGHPSENDRMQTLLGGAMLFSPANGTGKTGIIKIQRGTP